MNGKLFVTAAAKINIGLEIGDPGPDGYHPIVGVFQSVGIVDEIVCEVSDGHAIIVEGRFDCAEEDTTIHKAAKLFLERVGARHSVRLSVQKRIPAKAGLGGGSADAAATILALDRLLETGLDSAALRVIGREIGADVPFFMSGGAAVVSGFGEIVEPIPPRLDIGIVVAMPSFGVATKWAYAELDAFRRARGGPSVPPHAPLNPAARKDAMVSMFRGPVKDWGFINSFAPMLEAKYPVYGDMRALLGAEGALYSAITGSGACLYGVFASFNAARSACERLEAARRSLNGPKTLSGMMLRAVKPLETSIFLR